MGGEGGGGGGGGGGGYRSRQCWFRCTTAALTISTMTSSINSPLPFPLPLMGCIRIGVDDTEGIMDGLCDVDAS